MKNIVLVLLISLSSSFAMALSCDLNQVCEDYGSSPEACRKLPFCKLITSGGGCFPGKNHPTLNKMCAIGNPSRTLCNQSDQIARALYPEGCFWRTPSQVCQAKMGH